MAPVSASAGRPGRPATAPAQRVAKLVFIGFMGAGKTSAAARAGRRLGREALDSDALLEQRLGVPIAEFFAAHGETAFREREEELVLELLGREQASVVSLGGGAVESVSVRERLCDHVCVYLELDPELAWQRVRDSGRPLARDREQFFTLHAERIPLYKSLARATVPVGADGLSDEALDALAALAGSGERELRMTWASVGSGGYPVYVGRDALDVAGSLWPGGRRSFAVADAAVWELYGPRLERALAAGPGLEHVVRVPPGEGSKSLSQSEHVLRALARAGMERSDTLVALGGGVAGDLAGFCAAVYQRGVSVVHVPTTLVAQVDSAYGGKTGVDLPEAKNYVGSFHQPRAVFTDPGLLSSLPPAELRAGFAEVVKTALIAGGPLLRAVQALNPIERAVTEEADSVTAVIEGCLRAKLGVVARDERDHDVRASLNLGHTFAHALEAATGYASYRHGEAVAIGLGVALRLSERELGLDPSVREAVLELLARHGLRTTFDGAASEDVLARVALDKKRIAGRSNFVLLRAPGDVVTHCEVDAGAVRAAIEEARTT